MKEELGRERWTVICWDEDCTDPLDTYGYGDSYLNMAREHVRKHGHEVSVSLSRHDRFKPGGLAPGDRVKVTRFAGSLGTVLSVDRSNSIPYLVSVDNDTDDYSRTHGRCFGDDDVEFVNVV